MRTASPAGAARLKCRPAAAGVVACVIERQNFRRHAGCAPQNGQSGIPDVKAARGFQRQIGQRTDERLQLTP